MFLENFNTYDYFYRITMYIWFVTVVSMKQRFKRWLYCFTQKYEKIFKLR